MPALSDVRFDALRAQGYTGSTSDMLLQWLQDNDGGEGIKTIPDGWNAMLSRYVTVPPVQRNDEWFELLGFLGYEGQMNDRELQFWLDGGNLPQLVPGYIYGFTPFNNGGALRGFRTDRDPTAPPAFGELLPRRWDSQPGDNPLTRFTVNPANDLTIIGSRQRTQWLGATQLSVVTEGFDSETPFLLDWDEGNGDYRANVTGYGAYIDAEQTNLLGVNITPVDPISTFLTGTGNEPLVTENGEYLDGAD